MYFISISGISIVDFKQVNVSWEMVFRNVHDDRSSSLWAVLLLDTENDKQQKCGNSKFSKFWSSKNHLNFHKLSSHIKHWHFSSSWKFIKLERMILFQIYLDSWKVTSINDYKAIFRLSLWIIFLGQVFLSSTFW